MSDRKASLVGKVFASPQRRLDELLDEARELGVSTIAAAQGEPTGREVLMQPGRLQRVSGDGVVAGHAVTMWNPPGNNTMIRFGVELLQPGDILVIASATDEAAQIGDLACEWAHARGAGAIIVDGAVRDVAAVRGIGLSLWGRSVDPRQALKEALGYVNAPVRVAGVRVRPGDLVVADDDGILALMPHVAADAIQRARARAEGEAAIRAEARTGETPEALAGIFSAERIEFVGRAWSDPDGD